ncbi:MAG: hypothetical protein MK186_13685, partial [Henriciella sp.]|nr:hypothetical protein [Henriciella sp.]
PLDVSDDRLRAGFGCRIRLGVFGLHLRSFVTTTKPKHSLTYNPDFVPWALTGDRELHQFTLSEGQGNGLHFVAIDAAPNHMAMATITFLMKDDSARLA